MRFISDITRRDLFDLIEEAYLLYRGSLFAGTGKIDGMPWHGRIDEVQFLRRIYRLSEISSSDSRFKDSEGDIIQHRFNNDDWSDCWVLYDDRFELHEGEDEKLLVFICEMFHPAVRIKGDNWRTLFREIDELLSKDGYTIKPIKEISGREVFGWISEQGRCSLSINVDQFPVFDTEYIRKQLARMEADILDSPYDAIGKAKELVESCCKTILRLHEIDIDKDWKFPDLVRRSRHVLNLLPEDVPDNKEARETIKSILGSLGSIPNSIAELRNSYGSGHGKDADFKGLRPRHARLAVEAATAFVNFMLDTESKQNKSV